MSHHSIEESLVSLASSGLDQKRKMIEELQKEQLKETLGPTKDFPHGKLVPHDEGGLIFGVTVFNGRVVFDFGTPVRSIGFTREGALELAELIKRRAEQCPAIFVQGR